MERALLLVIANIRVLNSPSSLNFFRFFSKPLRLFIQLRGSCISTFITLSTVQNTSHFIYFHSYKRNYFTQKRFLNFIRLACIQTEFNGENDRSDEMGMVGAREGPISIVELLLLSITPACLQNSYYAMIYFTALFTNM